MMIKPISSTNKFLFIIPWTTLTEVLLLLFMELLLSSCLIGFVSYWSLSLFASHQNTIIFQYSHSGCKQVYRYCPSHRQPKSTLAACYCQHPCRIDLAPAIVYDRTQPMPHNWDVSRLSLTDRQASVRCFTHHSHYPAASLFRWNFSYSCAVSCGIFAMIKPLLNCCFCFSKK